MKRFVGCCIQASIALGVDMSTSWESDCLCVLVCLSLEICRKPQVKVSSLQCQQSCQKSVYTHTYIDMIHMIWYILDMIYTRHFIKVIFHFFKSHDPQAFDSSQLIPSPFHLAKALDVNQSILVNFQVHGGFQPICQLCLATALHRHPPHCKIERMILSPYEVKNPHFLLGQLLLMQLTVLFVLQHVLPRLRVVHTYDGNDFKCK